MTFFDVLSLVGGIALFLYGMDVLGKSLEKAAGSQLKSILSKLTNSTIKGPVSYTHLTLPTICSV